MTKSELIKELENVDSDTVIVGGFDDGGWDNIIKVNFPPGSDCPVIIFGGGSPFSDE